MTIKSQFNSLKAFSIFLSVFLFFLVYTPVRAETVTCTEVIPPVVIDAPGEYCLMQDRQFSSLTGAAVTFASDDILFDLNGYRLDGTAGPGTLAVGIISLPGLDNLTVKNGSLSGFYKAIHVKDNYPEYDTGGSHLIENIQAEGNFYVAIHTEGAGNIIRNNIVLNTGGTTIPGLNPYGTLNYGRAAQITGNFVDNTFGVIGQTSAYGLTVDHHPDGARIIGNRVTNTGGEATYPYGIIHYPRTPTLEADSLIMGNYVANAPDYGYLGIYGGLPDQVTCVDNEVLHYTIPYYTCADGGLNLP